MSGRDEMHAEAMRKLNEIEAMVAALRSENAELLAALTGVVNGFVPWVSDGKCLDCRVLRGRDHTPDCPWRVAVELRDRIAARGKDGAE